jgi:hypothetical protein
MRISMNGSEGGGLLGGLHGGEQALEEEQLKETSFESLKR